MSDDDKKAYKQLLLIAVLAIFGILLIVAVVTAYTQYSCIQLFYAKEAPAACSNGSMSRFVLEFIGIVVGTLAAIKLLGS